MKITAMAVMLMTGAVAYGQSTLAPPERKVTVCMKEDPRDRFATVPRARMMASKIFRDIGIVIEWRPGNCPAEGILISLSWSTPAELIPGALAYALPYEGTHIQVFYDRISQCTDPTMVSILLAHVLVHEITHIIEGIARHSATGIMKAHWDKQDFFRMRCKPLEFTDEDIGLIWRGLALPAPGAMVAMNPKPMVSAQ